MLYAGLDLSRQRLDVHVMDEDGSTVEVTAVHPDADALRTPPSAARGASANPGGTAWLLMGPDPSCAPRS